MASLTIRNATVQRIFFDGKGVALTETFTSRGEERKSYYTAWFDAAPNIQVGDILPTVTGLLQVKDREYEKDGVTKRAIDVAVNSARIDGVSAVQPAAVDDSNVPF